MILLYFDREEQERQEEQIMALSASPVPAPRAGPNRPMKPTFKSMPDLSSVAGSGGGTGNNTLTANSPMPQRRTSESDNQRAVTPNSAAAAVDAANPDDSDVLQQIVPVRDRRKMFEGASDVSRLTPRRYGSTGGGMGVSGAWPSMPSLTVRIKPDKPQPIPLVGTHTKPSVNHGDTSDLIHHTPVKGRSKVINKLLLLHNTYRSVFYPQLLRA